MILITRQKNFARQTSAKLMKFGYKTLSLPMLHMSYMYKDLMDDNYTAIIITSKNSVHAISHLKWLKKKKIYAVGLKTKDSLKRIGCNNLISCEESSQNIHALIKLVKENEQPNTKLLYISGVDVACDIEKELIDYYIKREIVYKALVTKSLSLQAIDSINSLINIVLFYSPRSALAFSKLIQKYKITPINKIAICISHNTALNLDKKEWHNIIISKNSNEDSIMERVEALLQ